MKNIRYSAPLFFTLALAFLSGARQPATAHVLKQNNLVAQSDSASKFLIMPAGTILEGRLDSTIGSAASQSGERFTITIASPVLANGVDVLIAAGSQILGEVVEAIPSRAIPHDKQTLPSLGKLRIQINALRTTDGITYPLVASLVADSSERSNVSQPVTGGVGYVGDANNFDAVAPGKGNLRRGNYGRPAVATREDVLRDPILGMDRQSNQQGHVRSLVKRGYDLFIDAGSPLTIKLNAPFKISLSRPNLDVPINESGSSSSTAGTVSPSLNDVGTAGGAEPPSETTRPSSVTTQKQQSETKTHSEQNQETQTTDTPF